MDKKNFEKDIDVPSKRLDRIDKMEIDLANYEQMELDIEKIIEPYQLNWELDCLSLPSAIQSILEHKEQECEELKKYETYYLDKYIALKDVLTEIKEIAQYDVYTSHTDLCIKLNWVKKKISEVEDGV